MPHPHHVTIADPLASINCSHPHGGRAHAEQQPDGTWTTRYGADSIGTIVPSGASWIAIKSCGDQRAFSRLRRALHWLCGVE